MADFKIQHITATITDGNSSVVLSAPTDFDAVNSTSYAYVKINSNNIVGNATGIRLSISGATAILDNNSQITVSRNGTTGNLSYKLEIIEFTSYWKTSKDGFTVRDHGELTFSTSDTSKSSSSKTVNNWDKCVALVTGVRGDDDSFDEFMVSASVGGSGSNAYVTLNRSTTSTNSKIYSYVLIEFHENWTVENNISHTFSASNTEEYETLDNSFNPNNSFIFSSKQSSTPSCKESSWISYFGSSIDNKLYFKTRGLTGSSNKVISHIVSHPDIYVTHYNNSLSSGTTFNVDISSSNIQDEENVSIIGTFDNDSTSTSINVATWSLNLTSTTNVTWTRGLTGSTNMDYVMSAIDYSGISISPSVYHIEDISEEKYRGFIIKLTVQGSFNNNFPTKFSVAETGSSNIRFNFTSDWFGIYFSFKAAGELYSDTFNISFCSETNLSNSIYISEYSESTLSNNIYLNYSSEYILSDKLNISFKASYIDSKNIYFGFCSEDTKSSILNISFNNETSLSNFVNISFISSDSEFNTLNYSFISESNSNNNIIISFGSSFNKYNTVYLSLYSEDYYNNNINISFNAYSNNSNYLYISFGSAKSLSEKINISFKTGSIEYNSINISFVGTLGPIAISDIINISFLSGLDKSDFINLSFATSGEISNTTLRFSFKSEYNYSDITNISFSADNIENNIILISYNSYNYYNDLFNISFKSDKSYSNNIFISFKSEYSLSEKFNISFKTDYEYNSLINYSFSGYGSETYLINFSFCSEYVENNSINIEFNSARTYSNYIRISFDVIQETYSKYICISFNSIRSSYSRFFGFSFSTPVSGDIYIHITQTSISPIYKKGCIKSINDERDISPLENV